MFMTVFVLRQSLRPFRPLDLNWFPVKWLNDKKCVRDVAVACLTFPFVVWLHGFSTTLLEGAGLLAYDDTVTTAWEQSMRSNDLVSKFFYVLLASFAAPVWEEAIFRGFLFALPPPSSTPERRCSSLPPSSPSPTSPSSNFSPSRSSDVSCASSLCAPETSSPRARAQRLERVGSRRRPLPTSPRHPFSRVHRGFTMIKNQPRAPAPLPSSLTALLRSRSLPSPRCLVGSWKHKTPYG